MVASKQNGDHCCVRFIFAKKLLVAMLKSLKDILVQVSQMSPWNMTFFS